MCHYVLYLSIYWHKSREILKENFFQKSYIALKVMGKQLSSCCDNKLDRMTKQQALLFSRKNALSAKGDTGILTPARCPLLLSTDSL
jgi:hypothetical protein